MKSQLLEKEASTMRDPVEASVKRACLAALQREKLASPMSDVSSARIGLILSKCFAPIADAHETGDSGLDIAPNGEGAATLAASSPQGVLRTSETIQRFQAIPVQQRAARAAQQRPVPGSAAAALVVVHWLCCW